ncbi:bifunctional serine/threonine-protein kinase/formylglycine-generating enzyme family protein [Myxococcota bacterium]|nr:bifunctional serine/threonine-protein kinase/formylglycine-generating enzyme family protein [Myxococcota bacterium]
MRRRHTTRLDPAGSPGGDPPDPPPAGALLPDRYEDLGLLARGGMGEVRRVRDRTLGRVLVLKTVAPDRSADPRVLAAFADEARLTASLQHPGIVPVHDAGCLPDGRPYYTMPEVRGRTLGDVIAAVHSPARDGDAAGWTFRRLVDAFARACEAVASAHARGVVHGDLKPDNVLLGPFGEVQVVDWGLAREVRDGAPGPHLRGGTPGYLAPEQARGEPAGPGADVYSLGAVLHGVLAGSAPAAPAPEGRLGPELPARPFPAEELEALCRAALAPDPAARPTAAAVAHAVADWLDESRRRERARGLVEDARAAIARADAARRRAAAVRKEADRLLGALPPWEGEEARRPGWELADRADALEAEAETHRLEADQVLRGALTHAPELDAAHALLAARYRDLHDAAERRREGGEAARYAALLRAHDDGRHGAWLRGDGRLTVVTDPPGAEIWLHRHVERDRRLFPEPEGSLGRTPLHDAPLPMGSWLLVLRAPGRAEVLHPVFIGREERWDGVPPRGEEPLPLPLPPAGSLGADERYVPPGWAWIGGDPDAPESLPRRRVWVDGFIARTHPVTNAEYLEFLEDLVREGGGEAPRHVPREPGEPGAPLYHRDPGGGFRLGRDAYGDLWLPDWPVTYVDWRSARAYAAWRARRDGLPWRLPRELEWEKAARGADGRFHPWGDRFESCFCCMRSSHPGRPLPVAVTAFPADVSPYGVRGLGGNVRDWCLDPYRPGGPLPLRVGGPGVEEPGGDEDAPRVIRGGTWLSPAAGTRAASRQRSSPGTRTETLGFRLVRSWPG